MRHLLLLAILLWPGQGWPQIERAVAPADGYQRLTLAFSGASTLGLLVTPLTGSLEGAQLAVSDNIACLSIGLADVGAAPVDSLACGVWLQRTPDDPIPGAASLALDVPPDVTMLRVQYERSTGAQHVEVWLLPEGTVAAHQLYLPEVNR